MIRKEIILATVDDAVSDLLYYDRKESSMLPLGAIEESLKAGEITVEEIIAKFAEALHKGLR